MSRLAWIPNSDRALINRFDAKLALARAAQLAVAGPGGGVPEPGRLDSCPMWPSGRLLIGN
jgi:hypothetical protein